MFVCWFLYLCYVFFWGVDDDGCWGAGKGCVCGRALIVAGPAPGGSSFVFVLLRGVGRSLPLVCVHREVGAPAPLDMRRRETAPPRRATQTSNQRGRGCLRGGRGAVFTGLVRLAASLRPVQTAPPPPKHARPLTHTHTHTSTHHTTPPITTSPEPQHNPTKQPNANKTPPTKKTTKTP